MRNSSVRLGSLLVVLVLTAAVFAFVLSDNGSEPGAEAQSGLSAPAIRSAAVSSSGRLTVRFAHNQIWQYSFDFKIHQLRDSGGLKLFKRVTAQSSPMRTNVDLGSEYRVEGRTCSRGSCGGWSDLFEVEVPAAVPMSTATATATSTVTATATATATSTATTTPEVMVDPATACYFLHSIMATATPTPTPTAANGSAGKETGEVTRDSVCSFPKLKRFLQRYACDAEAQMSANGARSDGGGFVEMTFMVEIKIVEGGDSGNVVSFLHANGAVGVIDWGVWVDAERVFQSVLGELSELPDVEFVQEMDGPSTGYSVAPSEQPAGPASATQRTMAQTFTDAPVWHGAKAWHDAGPPLRGDDVQISVIDVGFNGFRDLLAWI